MLSDLRTIHPRACGHWARREHSCKSQQYLTRSAQAIHSPAGDTQSPSLPVVLYGNFSHYEVGCQRRKSRKIMVVKQTKYLK